MATCGTARPAIAMVSVLLLAVSCGGRPTSSPSGPGSAIYPVPSASATPNPAHSPEPSPGGQPVTPSDGPLLVVLVGGSNTGLHVPASAISLIKPTGEVVTSVPIQVPGWPAIANCGNKLPIPAYIASGHVYWSDDEGVIRRVDRAGNVEAVTNFDLGTDEQIAFAVSPDGSQIEASILYVPPMAPGSSLGTPYLGRDPSSIWTNRTLLATIGGLPHLVAERDYKTTDGIPAPTEIVGWDTTGPIATVGTALCAQAVSDGHLDAESLVHLGSSGEHSAPMGGATCTPLDFVSDGPVLCEDTARPPLGLSVRTGDGRTIWTPTAICNGDLRLSPDGNRVLGLSCLVSRDPAGGPPSVMPSQPQLTIAPFFVGWYSSDTVVTGPNGLVGSLSLVSADDLQASNPLGIQGSYLGALLPAG